MALDDLERISALETKVSLLLARLLEAEELYNEDTYNAQTDITSLKEAASEAYGESLESKTVSEVADIIRNLKV